AILASFDPGADEPQSATRIGRMQREGDRQSRMDAHTEQGGVVAQRGLPGDFHTPRPTHSPSHPPGEVARGGITRATPSRNPAIGKAIQGPRARFRPRCPPTKTPLTREA